MEFEFDPVKSNANRAKHGIDFVEAQALWYDAKRKIVPLTFDREERFLIIAMIGSLLWTGVFTWRDRRVRIISVRRARRTEKVTYEQNHG